MSNPTMALALKLERERGKLSRLARKYGFRDKRVLEQNRRVDRLAVEMQRRKMTA